MGWGLGRGLGVGRLGVEGRGEAWKLEGLSFPGFVAPWPGGLRINADHRNNLLKRMRVARGLLPWKIVWGLVMKL